ncbi:hypothetical protein GT030_26640 [Streptomyces sp. SID1328]|uniref:hypothetical protein n=1 Tax=Streptomyces sp. SID1328 TaxID=2690250 RepID=UPI00136833FC|nr:hypothetical protein [Streptomyces sp. SID1328]MYV42348.1 hypothetical protein [Streptomyces sp. SID1328]
MAKERVTVCVPRCEPGDLPEVIGAAMVPYEYGRRAPGEPEVETWWDYWRIDGGGCEFRVVAGHEDDARLVRATHTLSGEPRDLPLSLCDGGPRGLLDLETPRARAAAEARGAFEAWRAFAAGYPPVRPSGYFWARHYADPEGYPVPQAVEDYRTQPALVALADRPELEDLVGGDPAARLVGDLGTYMREAADQALPTNALLTLDGRWLVIAGPERYRYFNEYLDSRTPDTMVVRVLYHC